MADKTPEHIGKYKKLRKHAERIADTTERHHVEAYYHAVDETIKKKGEMHADYGLLEEAVNQERFAKSMANYYVEKAKKYFKVKGGDLGELEKGALMQAYAGVTEAELHHYVSSHKSKFKFRKFKEYFDHFIEAIRGRLESSASGHITERHIEDVLKYVLKDDAVKKLKDYLPIEKAKLLLANFIGEEKEGEEPEKYDLRKVIGMSREIRERTKEKLDVIPQALEDKLEKELKEEKKKKKKAA